MEEKFRRVIMSLREIRENSCNWRGVGEEAIFMDKLVWCIENDASSSGARVTWRRGTDWHSSPEDQWHIRNQLKIESLGTLTFFQFVMGVADKEMSINIC